MEMAFSQEVLLELGYSWSEVEQNLAWLKVKDFEQKIDWSEVKVFPEEIYEILWAHYRGKEEDFFYRAEGVCNAKAVVWWRERGEWAREWQELVQRGESMIGV
jgi:hypothetical protein